MADESQSASGVQDLISRIRDDGVQSGKEEAERIVVEARREADRLIADAQGQSEEMRQKASAEIESVKHAALEALKMAARDTQLQLQAQVVGAFQQHVKRLVADVTNDGSGPVIQALVRSLKRPPSFTR